ncbi:Phage-related baseplate assembly protein [Pseudomonas cuatrocienegasensis]|uniref:Phage-related baseplate assembly protein n=1 Tax=Pseudomonas cuatrocienegasensis TaxID=543360 RepID=A0ABY1BQX2_9PSED|nr:MULTISPECIES: baseplate J/gp47 family protein [Pseudomonas]OEC32876.1 baseplate J protein [Pseudomonas sp. 21C1]SER41194.1 Phage-related baseplate assembly protein [Pseudomonas cuatrocienegasensis]
MLIPGLNQLAEPEIVKVEAFEPLLAEFKAEVLAYVAARDPQKAARLAESLDNDSELLTMALQAFTVRLQTHERKYNARIKQHLAWWAEGSNLDARLADMGLMRRVISEGDPSAFPPVPAVVESDDDARIRYYLAPHAPAAGSRLQYRREAMTLGERAKITIERNDVGQLVVTYTFDPDGFAAQVKDANGRRTAPGEVTVTVLARAGDGTPSAALLAATRAHFARDDVRPETDLVTVRAAEILRYRIRAVVYINNGPDSQLTQGQAEAALQAYASARHLLEGYVDPSRIDYVLHAAGAERLQLLEPLAPIECAAHQAPYCEGVEIEVRTL